jgi:hypothetical protein
MSSKQSRNAFASIREVRHEYELIIRLQFIIQSNPTASHVDGYYFTVLLDIDLLSLSKYSLKRMKVLTVYERLFLVDGCHFILPAAVSILKWPNNYTVST